MSKNRVVPREEWFRAHEKHLAREKELTRLREKVAAERRDLPWLRIRKDYVFETECGPAHLADLFDGKSQLIVYHFMFGPGADHRCEGCSFLADHIDGADQHLRHHDVSLKVVARAPWGAPAAGVPITIQRRAGARWHTVRHVRTNASGLARVRVRTAHRPTYRAAYGGGSWTSGRTAPVRVRR